MKALFFLALPILSLTACIPAACPPSPIPVPIPIPPPTPTGPEVYAITPENCPTVRVTRDNNEYSSAWGGEYGLRVPPNGFSIQAKREQIECRIDNVFRPF